jgi:replicative DNA helicase Mcm
MQQRWIDFYDRYYQDEISELAQAHASNKERESLYIEYGDLWTFDADLAHDWINKPTDMQAYAEDALANYDLPADVDLSGAHVRLRGFDDDMRLAPSDLTKDHAGDYVAIHGDLSRVTNPDDIPLEIAYECQRCGTMTYMPVDASADDLPEPTECQGCERKGPFSTVDRQSDWEDYCKLKVEAPPEANGDLQNDSIEGFAVGDVVHYGHEYGLLGRTGERATVYGVVERRQKNPGRNGNSLLFERILRVEAVEFDAEEDTVEIEQHRDEFEELANRPDAVDLFASSLAPELYATDAWETAMEWGIAYLFSSPRIDIPNGPTYRGDIHGGIISDFGMGKSMFASGVADYSPNVIRKSATGLASDVGLTAAAVKDDFGEGQWTIKPGLLVRANGGHLILDEIDKGPDDLSKINDSIEQEQTVDVDKAGSSVTYYSRCGLLILGNPEDGRFNHHESTASQIGVDSSTLSRFDGLITMKDQADEEIDGKVAERALEAFSEAQETQYFDRDEFDVLDRPVPVDVGRAWVKHARENVVPLFEKDRIPSVKKWYAEEVRKLNEKYANNEGEGADMPVPASARVVMWVARYSVAFARVHLRERVTDDDVERAKKLSKRLISQNWDGEKFVADETVKDSQNERRDKIVEQLSDTALTASEVADNVKWSHDTVRQELENDHRVVSLTNGRYERK